LTTSTTRPGHENVCLQVIPPYLYTAFEWIFEIFAAPLHGNRVDEEEGARDIRNLGVIATCIRRIGLIRTFGSFSAITDKRIFKLKELHRIVDAPSAATMVPSNKRAATAAAPMSTTAIAAIITGIGVVMLCLLGALIFLLVRAVRAHKRLIADLDERGISLAQAHKEMESDPVARPRAVIKRNTVLPFNKTSGWGTLPSTETFRSADSGAVPEHYVPPIPANATKRSNLSWPFSKRRMRNRSVQMSKMKITRLSTVMESPNLSPMPPDTSSVGESGQFHARSSGSVSRSPSCQSLLQQHPAFRHQHQATGPPGAATRGSVAVKTRPHRAQSVDEISTGQTTRPYVKTRSVSLCSRKSGEVPDIMLPPLPSDMSRLESLTKEFEELNRVPSKVSLSSLGSADTAILDNRNSPANSPPAQSRGQKITKPNTKGSAFAGGKNIRDTLDLRAKVLGSRHSSEANTPIKNTTTEATRQSQDEQRSTLMEELNIQLPSSVESEKSVCIEGMPQPATSPPPMRNSSSKRKSRTFVSSSGSPERQDQPPTNSRMVARRRSPKRQDSQASSRSSGGNPFQWDQTPSLYSSTKPSNLKGSPSARRGHGRKNSVRISLVPTIHRSPNRVSSQSLYNQDGFTEAGASENGLGLEWSSTHAISRLPTASTFAPDLKFTATSLRATLTSTSATLPLIGYDQSFVVFPTDQILPPLSDTEQRRLSSGSMFSLSRFPAAPRVFETDDIITAYQHGPLASDQDFNVNWIPGTPMLQQHPFGVSPPERNQSPSPTSIIDIDEYHPEQVSCIYHTPPNPNVTSRIYQSAFAPIPEESSVCSNKTLDGEVSRSRDSPSVSPMAMSPPRFSFQDRSAYNLPVHATCIPEEIADTIDPTILSKAASNTPSNYSSAEDSVFGAHASENDIGLTIPPSPRTNKSTPEPLPEATSPGTDSPTMGHDLSELSLSCYTRSPSPSPTNSPIKLPSPKFPCSPRPAHALLPVQNLSLNFAAVPTLHPSPRGPRSSPPRPLRTSIAQLRRMNSEAVEVKDTKAARGERRYLRIDRENNPRISGESWLDELEDSSTVELDEDEGRRLVGNLLEDGIHRDESCTIFDFEATDDHFMGSIKSNSPHTKTSVILDCENSKFSTAESSHRSSSIWGDGEKFWTSPTPPPPPPSTPRKYNTYHTLASSPLASPSRSSPSRSTPSTPTLTHRRRHFSVARDAAPHTSNNEDNPPSPLSSPPKFQSFTPPAHAAQASGTGRKRIVLGTGTPNVSPSGSPHMGSPGPGDADARVRIQITTPGGRVLSGSGAMASLYDRQGFLRI